MHIDQSLKCIVMTKYYDLYHLYYLYFMPSLYRLWVQSVLISTLKKIFLLSTLKFPVI